MKHSLFPTIPILLAMGATGSFAKADTIENLTYNVTLQAGIDGVSQILFLGHTSVGGTGYTWPYSLPGGSGSITERWDITVFPEITDTIAIGLVSGIAGDIGPTLAVFGNYAAGQIGESFSTLFPDANEAALISDLTNVFIPNCEDFATSGLQLCTAAFQNDVKPLFNDAASDGLFIASGGNLDVVAYTDGQLIGAGTMDVIFTPEPSTFTLFVCAALAFLGASRLRAPR